MKLLVLDGNSIVNRAFYGIKLLTTKNGQYTNAIFGFINILLKLQESEQPDEIAIAFDLKAPTFRHEMYDGYKAKRKGMPEELAAQMPILKELLTALGYQLVSKEGYEADDILGTLAAAAEQRGDICLLATGDRDSLQLIDNNVTVLLTTTQFGKGETTRIDVEAVQEKYGISPRQLIDVKALMGDASDNIPGVPGIGEKTALGLIQKFGSVEGVYQNLEDSFIKPGARKKLEEGIESAKMSYQLATIDCNVPVNSKPGDYVKQAVDAETASRLLSNLEMYSILERVGLERSENGQLSFDSLQNEPAEPVIEIEAQSLEATLSGVVYIAPAEDKWLLVPQDKKEAYFAEADSPLLLQMLQDPDVEKRGYDTKELHKIALAAGAPAQNIAFDAKLAAYLLNPNSSEYAVGRLAAADNIAPLFSCDMADAGLLQPLYAHLDKECIEQDMQKLLYKIEQPLAEVLASMELVGVAMNAEGVREFGVELQTELQKQLASVYEAVGYEFNLNSPKQLSKALFEDLGLPTRKKTKSGFSTDAETLESLREYHPVIDTILLYRTYQKLNSTYVEGLLKVIGSDGRIHSTFNQTEARTGRLSSNEPNMQNIPVRTELGSHLRNFFVAAPGDVLADADYSQIELRILASISKDAAMQDAFLKGHDIHRATAAKVNGVPLEEVTPQMRSAAKAVNFGIVYGIGAFSLSKDIGVTVKEADAFIQNYLDNFPGVRTYMEDIVEFGKENGYVATLFGRRRPLPELASSNRNIKALGERIALNTPIQGTAADIIKLAMNRVYRRLRDEGLQAKLVLQVHDELIVETPEHEIEQVKTILHDEMVNAAQLAVPLEADVHIGKNWLQAKG